MNLLEGTLENQTLHAGLAQCIQPDPPLPAFKACVSAMAGLHFLRLTRHLLLGGCGQSHMSVKDG